MMNGVATKNLAPGLGQGNIYEPRIYGFRVSEVAKTGPRMKWLRSRPVDINEVDECRIWAQSKAAAAIPHPPPADSEMPDHDEEAEDDDVEDEDMDAVPVVGSEQENYDMEDAGPQIRETSRRKKQSRRRNHDGLLNGNTAGGTAVSVGDGG